MNNVYFFTVFSVYLIGLILPDYLEGTVKDQDSYV
jgi:hypothetical protein